MTYEYNGPKNQYNGHPRTIVIVSGYFIYMHVGHKRYLEAAKQLAGSDGELWVIVNNDEQQKDKKGEVIMNADDRMEIVDSIKYVDRVILSIDRDRSQCRTLEAIVKYNPGKLTFIFANGGDRCSGEIPESDLCRKKQIKMVDGVGGDIKADSSTRLIAARDTGEK